MRLLEHTPAFDAESAAAIAQQHFGLQGFTAHRLPSERDQNFLLTDLSDQKFVLKIANALEEQDFLDAQNSVLKYLEQRVSFCQRLVPGTSGDDMVRVQASNGATHFARLVHYLPGVPLAEVKPQPSELLRDLGRTLGQLERALVDFDHRAVHRDFHWDLANGNGIIDEFAELIDDPSLRELVGKCRFETETDLRRSVIHGDANDHNVLVDRERMVVTGLIDFGDMVYSYTVGNLAVAIAYVVLDKPDPRAAALEVVAGYTQEFPLLDNEIEILWRLVLLRLAMSVCMAAYQRQHRPDNEYLEISQRSIEENLPRLLEIADLRG